MEIHLYCYAFRLGKRAEESLILECRLMEMEKELALLEALEKIKERAYIVQRDRYA